jgi:hypothetical protein
MLNVSLISCHFTKYFFKKNNTKILSLILNAFDFALITSSNIYDSRLKRLFQKQRTNKDELKNI